MTTPDLNDPYGQMECATCKGKGYTTCEMRNDPTKAFLGTLPCTTCRRTGKVLRWWPDAFVSEITLDGPLLVSTEDDFHQHVPPDRVKWRRALVPWKLMLCVYQGPFTNRIFCLVSEEPITTRSVDGYRKIQTTRIDVGKSEPLLIGLPYPLVAAAWKRFLAKE